MDQSGRGPDRWQPSELLLVLLTALLLLVVAGTLLALLRAPLDIRLTRILLTALLAIALYRPLRSFVVARWPESEGLVRVHAVHGLAARAATAAQRARSRDRVVARPAGGALGRGPRRWRGRPTVSARAAFALILGVLAATAASADPKYGPAAVRLHDDRTYLQQSPAPDFWALAPYYLPQLTGSSCSAASVAMLMNGLRVDLPLSADEKLVTERDLLKRAANAAWQKAAAEDGDGVSLDQLGRLIERSLAAYGLGAHEVEVVHVESTSDEMLARLRKVLAANEASTDDFILINFVQSVFTGDPEGNVGHISPIGAYDAGRQRVLVMDVDRSWYEPYWVTDRTLLAGMARPDDQAPGKGVARGYVHVRRARGK